MRNLIKAPFGGGGTAGLPRRIAGAIGEQQDASERLIGWIQLAVA